MKLALIGDAHLIADDDPYKGLHRNRAFFKQGWRSFADLLARVNAESPDVVVFVGDLVDWFSPQNVDFALELVGQIKARWHWTPGNHDVAAPVVEFDSERYALKAGDESRACWARHGCDGQPRSFTDGAINLVTFDSALSSAAEGSESWLEQALQPGAVNLVATHVPVDLPCMREWILARDPQRNLKKYVMSGSPHLYEQCLSGRTTHMFAGHLHMGGRVSHNGTTLHLLNMSITTRDPHRATDYVASATIVEPDGSGELSVRQIRAGEA